MPHGGANGLVSLLPASLCESDKSIRVALGERHAEKCAMRKTLSGGLWIVSIVCPQLLQNIIPRLWSLLWVVVQETTHKPTWPAPINAIQFALFCASLAVLVE